MCHDRVAARWGDACADIVPSLFAFVFLNRFAPDPFVNVAELHMKVATLRILAIFRHLATWRQRARFRAQLRTDIEGAADLLRDIGIDVAGAQIEAQRFFWQPIALKRRQVPSAEAVLRDEMEVGLRSDKLREPEGRTSQEFVVKDGDVVRLGDNSVGALETPTKPSTPRLARINR
jgi:uncharacterized protein YjiS (DUF1127 family)